MASRFITKGSTRGEFDSFARRYVFKPARNAEELRDLLRVRTAAFRNIQGGRLAAHSLTLDVDAYDRFAHHLGLFEVEPDGIERAIGYARLITETPSPQANQLFRIVKTDPESSSRVSAKRPTPFPSIGYFPELASFYEMARRAGERLLEPSRLSLEPTLHSARLARFLAFGATAYALSAGFTNGLMTSRHTHLGMYRLLGFAPYNDDPALYVYSIGWEALPVIRWHSELDLAVRDEIEGLSDQFRATGRAYLEPRHPNAAKMTLHEHLPSTLQNCA